MPGRDVDVRAVAWTGLAIAAAIALVIGSVFVLLHVWRVPPGADRLRLPYAVVIAGPALQSAPQPELDGERAAKARLLTTSAWLDGAHGVVRIPIATAMRVLAERGRRTDAAAPAAAPASESGSTR